MCNEQDSEPYKTFFGEDTIDKLLNNKIKKVNIVVKKLKQNLINLIS